MLSRFTKWLPDKRLDPVFGCLAVLCVLGLLSTLGCRKNPASEIDFGSVTNSVYRNQYFGLAVPLPEGWTILDQAARERSRQSGIATLAGNDSAFAKQLKAADMQSVSLFTAYRKPPGSPPPNPSILAVAEKVSREVTGGRDYLAGARDLFKAGQMTVRFPKEIYIQNISGADFAILEVEIFIDGKKARQKQYCTLAKGYALAFVISFTTDKDESFLTGVMESVRFDSTAASKRPSGTAAPVR